MVSIGSWPWPFRRAMGTGLHIRKRPSLNQSYKEAVLLYPKAAAQGHAEAQLTLGLLYEHGKGVLLNYETAALLYRKTTEQDDSDAQYYLGYVYRRGPVVLQSAVEAALLYRKTAEQGVTDA